MRNPLAWIFIVLAAANAQAVKEAFVEIPGARIFYTDSGGNGVPVVLLHAATGSSRVWEYQIPAFAKAGYRVIAYDRRGWGRTEVSSTEPSTTSDDLLAILDALKLQKVHLIGTAAGGFTAFDFALSFPERLRSLVVANSIGGIQDEDFLALGRRIRPPAFDALPPELREVGPDYRAANPKGTERWVELEKISKALATSPAQKMRNRLTLAALEQIKVPTFLLTGGADMYAPPAIQQLFAAHIKGAETLVVPDAGHSTYWEQPEAFNRAVLGFIRKH